jgi:hypothetical protein
MSVKKGSTPRDDVLQGELDDAIFAASRRHRAVSEPALATTNVPDFEGCGIDVVNP